MDRGEILRYMGAGPGREATEQLVDQCLVEALPLLSYRVCWRRFAIPEGAGEHLLPFDAMGSRDIKKCLEGAREGILFAATLGLSLDRALFQYGRTAPSRGICFQAIGAERIESLCDGFCRDMASETGLYPGPRFSPGYGDLPLLTQKEIFRLLDCPGRIGLTLTDSLLMSPSKSVTAVFGLYPDRDCRKSRGCSACKKTDCNYRRNG